MDERMCECVLVCLFVCVCVDCGDNHEKWNRERWPKGWFRRKPFGISNSSEYIFHKICTLASVDLTQNQYSYRVRTRKIYIVKSSIMWEVWRVFLLHLSECVCKAPAMRKHFFGIEKSSTTLNMYNTHTASNKVHGCSPVFYAPITWCVRW